MTKRKADLLNTIVDMIHASDGAGVSRRDVGSRLGLKQTPYLWDMLREIVASGWAREVWDTSLERPAYRYYPASPVVVEKLTPEDYMG